MIIKKRNKLSGKPIFIASWTVKFSRSVAHVFSLEVSIFLENKMCAGHRPVGDRSGEGR